MMPKCSEKIMIFSSLYKYPYSYFQLLSKKIQKALYELKNL